MASSSTSSCSATTTTHVSSPNGSTSPCGACKFLRRKCVPRCIFAPYFSCEQGPARFAAIHKVFGASNVSKLLLRLPLPHRSEALLTISYQAQARIHDPVYGCVAHIFALQRQVGLLQTQLMQAKAELAQTLMDSEENMEIQWTANFNDNGFPNYQTDQIMNPTATVSPQSSQESSAANHDESLFMNFQFQESQSRSSSEAQFQRKILSSSSCHADADVGELQALALRMMRN